MAVQLAPPNIAALLAANSPPGQPMPTAQTMQPGDDGMPSFLRPQPEPFVWGEGGARMTPADIKIAQELAARGAEGDYSPVQHWSQGLGRVLDGLSAGMDRRRAGKAEEANAAQSRSVAEILAGDGATDADLMGAVSNPYIDPVVRTLADSMRKERAELNKPEYFMSGRDRVKYDPRAGQSSIIYDGAEDHETYARQFGEPGTPEYQAAAQDFVLRSNGPTAFGYDVDLEGVRQENREDLEGVRYRNRLSLRQTPTYSQANPRPASTGGGSGSGAGGKPRAPTMAGTMAPLLAKVARGERLSPAEQQAWSMYRPGRDGSGSGSRTSAAPRTATDPKTGRKVQWNGKAWVPAG